MRKWTRQPSANAQIDWRHPIAKKLGFLWIGPHTGGRYGRDLVSGTFGIAEGTGDVPTVGVSEVGHHAGQIQDGASIQRITFTNLRIVRSGVSFFTISRNTDNSQYWRSSLSAFSSTASFDASTTQFVFYPSGDDASNNVYSYTGMTFQWNAAGFSGTEGNWHSYGVRHPAGTDTIKDLFIDGSSVGAADSGAQTPKTADILEVQLLSNAFFPDEGLGGDMYFAAIFTEELSDSEFASLHANPWQLLKPPLNFGLADPLPQTRSLTMEVPWTKQPPIGTPINGSNELSKKLIFAWKANDFSGGELRGYSADERFRQGTLGSPVLKDGVMIPDPAGGTDVVRVGNHLSFNKSTVTTSLQARSGETGWDSLSQSYAAVTKPVTYVVSARTGNYVSQGSSYNSICEYNGRNAILIRSGNLLSFNQGGAYVDTSFPMDTADFNHVVFVHRHDSSAIWYNGEKHGTELSEQSQPASSAEFHIAGSFTTTRECDCDIEYLYIFSGELTEAEQASLRKNPWQIFKPQELHVPIEYEELTFDEEAPEGLYFIPQKWTEQPK